MVNRVERIMEGGWTVEVLVDEDGDLNIWVSHAEGCVVESDADIADSDRTWAVRLVDESWRIAQRGHELDSAIRQLDPTALRAKLATLQSKNEANPNVALATAIASVEAQLATSERLKQRAVDTVNSLRLAQTRLDELASRSAEIALGAGDTERYEHEVDDLVIELEALRQAVQLVEGIEAG